MLPIPPQPPAPSTPPPQKQIKQSPFYQIIVPKQARNQLTSAPEVPFGSKNGLREKSILRSPRRTNPLVWCGAILCLIFSVCLIAFGITTLIIFLAIKPRNPVFDTPTASLNVVYFDSPQFINGDITFLVNVTNPNRKLDVRFEYLDLELYFSDTLIATQSLQPFTQRPGHVRLIPVHLLSSLVYLPPSVALDLQKQVLKNRVAYRIKGTFRVGFKLGLIRYSYWLHGRCQIVMTSPPNGVMVFHSCKIKR